MAGKAYIVGTCDTKFAELNFVKQKIHEAGLPCVLVDVGTLPHKNPVDISAETVANHHPTRKDLLTHNTGRGDAVIAMSEALEQYLLGQQDIAGIIGLGGSGGTSLVSRGLRALPVGLPKVMVSTVASGNTAPYVGASDIFMLYSITDIAGINQISHTILSNAAHALIGMMQKVVQPYTVTKPAVAMTMFGVTTPCVNHLREQLEENYDCLVFHATGSGGIAMEKLIDSGFIKKVIDITTTEVCDLIAGGIMSAGEDRMGAIIRQKIPYIGSVGALDMVNFGPMHTVPDKYKDESNSPRNLYVHNAEVTLMRINKEENIQMGQWIAQKLNQMTAPVRFFIPEKGVSLLSVEGQPFHDSEADQALFETLEQEIKQTENRKLIRLPYHINDPAFAREVATTFLELNS